MIDYEKVKKHFADTLAADFAGRGRFESAFYHTIKMVHDTTREQTVAESAGRIASLQSCYDTLLNNAADAHERIAELERTVKTLREALTTTGEGNAALLAENARLKRGGEPVAWIRFCTDGGYEGPIMNSHIEDVRKASGAWTPLYPAAPKQGETA